MVAAGYKRKVEEATGLVVVADCGWNGGRRQSSLPPWWRRPVVEGLAGSWFRWGRVFKGGEGGEGGPRQVLSLKLSLPVLLHHGSMNLGLAKFRPEISM